MICDGYHMTHLFYQIEHITTSIILFWACKSLHYRVLSFPHFGSICEIILSHCAPTVWKRIPSVAIFISLSSRTRFSTTQHCSEKMKYNTTLPGKDEERFFFELNQSMRWFQKHQSRNQSANGVPPRTPLREALSYQTPTSKQLGPVEIFNFENMFFRLARIFQ